MSAYEFDDEQLKELTAALKKRLDSLPLFPHQRLGYPPMLIGQDVTAPILTVEQTASYFRRLGVN